MRESSSVCVSSSFSSSFASSSFASVSFLDSDSFENVCPELRHAARVGAATSTTVFATTVFVILPRSNVLSLAEAMKNLTSEC